MYPCYKSGSVFKAFGQRLLLLRWIMPDFGFLDVGNVIEE
jgi:hypothetical protein